MSATLIESASLAPSPLWNEYARKIEDDLRSGLHYSESFTMNIVIKQRDLRPYRIHRTRLDELLWSDDPEPKTIIDLGAGYGAMANFWPEDSTVYNIDLGVMLDIQKKYIEEEATPHPSIRFQYVPITDVDSIPIDGAYLFSVWALTETTMDTWRYWIERAPRLAGAYILGFDSWVDEKERWPWDELAGAFKTVRAFNSGELISKELAAVNR